MAYFSIDEVPVQQTLETEAQFHQLDARRKLQKARLFWFIFQNVVINKTTKLFELYALRGQVGAIETDSLESTKLLAFEKLIASS